MTKNIYIKLLIVLSLVFSSCEKFLDVPYDNRVELNNLDDIEAVLVNAYPMRADVFTEILTDNFHHYATTMQASNGATYIPIYLWKDEYSDAITTATPTHAYAHYYKKIYEVNSVIEELGNLSGTSPKSKAVLGESLVLRAFNYFTLVNLFSLHYDESSNEKNLGVPLITEVPKDNRALFDRASVKEVYDQIDKDLQEGVSLLESNVGELPRTPYRFSLASVYAFLSRVNLYKGKWDEAAQYADKVIEERGTVVRKLSEDITRKNTTSEVYFAQEIMNPTLHPNLLLVNQTNAFLCRPFGYRLGGFYLAHDVFYKTPSNDLRKQLFSSGGTVIDSVALVIKYANQPNNPNAAASRYDVFTVEEVLLNRAEANLRKTSPDIEKAMTDIEAIRRERISPYSPLPTPSSVEDALAIVLAERKLELIGQGFRWYDIKRLGIRVEHRLVRTSKDPDEVLEPNDKRTALQIPVQARLGNPLLENQLNPR